MVAVKFLEKLVLILKPILLFFYLTLELLKATLVHLVLNRYTCKIRREVFVCLLELLQLGFVRLFSRLLFLLQLSNACSALLQTFLELLNSRLVLWDDVAIDVLLLA
jgi:hypothetical protein